MQERVEALIAVNGRLLITANGSCRGKLLS